MKKTFVKLLTVHCLVLNSRAFAQSDSLVANPTGDASIGYHYLHDTENNNYGSAVHFSGFCQPGTYGGVNYGRGLMKFDLSTVPPGASITAAYLDLYGIGPCGTGAVASVGNVGPNDCYIERVTSPWAEYIVTFNTRPSVTTTNQVLLPSSSAVSQDYFDINVTNLVQDMIADPANSFGFQIRLVNETISRGLFFTTRDYFDSGRRPTLRIYWDTAAGTEPSTAAGMDFMLGPNPCSEFTHLKLNPAAGNVEIAILDCRGVVLTADRVSGAENHTIETESLTPGVYFVRVSGEAGARVEKFIKM